jgi:hypothetical protein
MTASVAASDVQKNFGLDAVARWAEEAYGADWKSMPERSASPEEDRFAKEFKDACSKLDPNHKLGF